jgi:hypothetical protein
MLSAWLRRSLVLMVFRNRDFDMRHRLPIDRTDYGRRYGDTFAFAEAVIFNQESGNEIRMILIGDKCHRHVIRIRVQADTVEICGNPGVSAMHGDLLSLPAHAVALK